MMRFHRLLLITSMLIAWLATLVSGQAYLRRQSTRALKGPGGGPKDGGGPGPKDGGGPGPKDGGGPGPKDGGGGPKGDGPKGKGKGAKGGGKGGGPKGSSKKGNKKGKSQKKNKSMKKKSPKVIVPTQCPPLQSFTANVMVNIVGDPNNVTRADITTLESGFRNTYNSLSFDNCDNLFRFVTSVTAETDNGSQVIPRGGNMFSLWFLVQGQCRNCDPSTVTLFSPPARRRLLDSQQEEEQQQQQQQDERFALASQSPFGDQIEMEVSEAGVRKGIIILPFISPTEAPVEAPRSYTGETLTLPQEATLIQPRIAPRPATPVPTMAPSPTPPTILYFETNCTCLSSKPKNRAPTELEFSQAFDYFLRGSGIYRPRLRVIDSVTEIAKTQCSGVIERFTVYVSVEFFGNINFVKPAEKQLLEQSFQETYNGLIASRCDAPTFRMVTSVGLQSQTKVPNVRGAFKYIFKVVATCHGRGCSAGLTLFDGAAGRMLLSAIFHPRRVQNSACYCPIFNPASGAPSAADFGARFGVVVLDLFHSFQLQNLDASGNVAEVTLNPTSAPTMITKAPSIRPTKTPTVAPTPAPTFKPTILRTPLPTILRTKLPSAPPSTVMRASLTPTTPVSTISPTTLVTKKPTRPKPTSAPTPGGTGTNRPTIFGNTHAPTGQAPSSFPTSPVTPTPTTVATPTSSTGTTQMPSTSPSLVSGVPSITPSTAVSSNAPSVINSSFAPSVVNASFSPSIAPSSNVSIAPTIINGTHAPTSRAPTVANGTHVPTAFKSEIPSIAPSLVNGTNVPTKLRSEFPSMAPSQRNGTLHSRIPSVAPSINRTHAPAASEQPSHTPSILPASPIPTMLNNTTQRPTTLASEVPSTTPSLLNGTHRPTSLQSATPSTSPSRVGGTLLPTRLTSDHPSASPSKIGGATTLPSLINNASEVPSQAPSKTNSSQSPSKRRTTSPSKSALPTITAIPTGAFSGTKGPSILLPTALPVTSEFPSLSPSTIPSKLVPGSSQPISGTAAPSKVSRTTAPSTKSGASTPPSSLPPTTLSSKTPNTRPSISPSTKVPQGSNRPSTSQAIPSIQPQNRSDAPSQSPSVIPSTAGGTKPTATGGSSQPISSASPNAAGTGVPSLSFTPSIGAGGSRAPR